jgi:Flp pilus assembly protein TadG
MPILAILLVPMIAAVGVSVDYTSAVSTRSSMQDALDSAALAITTLPTGTSNADRQVKLQDAFKANQGQGTATLDSFTLATDGTVSINVSARYAMPTDFMQIARVTNVQIGVVSAVRKTPALVQATFKIDKVSGYWGKTMTLFGTSLVDNSTQTLMTITYVFKKFTATVTINKKNYNVDEQKGWGTTTISTKNGSTSTKVEDQVCTPSVIPNLNNLPAGAITTVSVEPNTKTNVYFLINCVRTVYPVNGAGAAIDVSQMDALYLQMDVPSGSPKVLKSNDPATSNRLYIDDVEVLSGKTVDIFTVVPCGQASKQAWEDGGSAVPAPVVNADFFYTVTGKCAYTQRASETMLTQ